VAEHLLEHVRTLTHISKIGTIVSVYLAPEIFKCLSKDKDYEHEKIGRYQDLGFFTIYRFRDCKLPRLCWNPEDAIMNILIYFIRRNIDIKEKKFA
jgi:hypothetical protein